MKVVKEPVIWKIEKECIANKNNDGGCEALLEVEAVDIYLSYQQKANNDKRNSELSNYNDFSYTFKCPCCNKETLIDDSEIPIEVRKAILNIEQANGTKLKYLKKLGYR